MSPPPRRRSSALVPPPPLPHASRAARASGPCAAALLVALCGVSVSGCRDRDPQPAAAAPSVAAAAAAGVTDPLAEPGEREGPFVRVLGTAQDGGLPQPGCTGERCRAARRHPERARRVASLAVVLPEAGRIFLIDATPDLPAQLGALADLGERPDRRPVDGVLLTHAHMGHYLGLAFFGFEAMNSRSLPVWCTPRMARFLRSNEPWKQLVALENIELHESPPAGPGRSGARIALGGGVTAVPVSVPHRDELSDTVAWRLEGPRRTLLYLPDIDGWEEWGSGLEAGFAGVDVALVDGTFYSDDELPGRDVSAIGHPRIIESVERFGAAVARGELEVAFVHLNHSNPALDPDAPERRVLEAAGFSVLDDGEELPL